MTCVAPTLDGDLLAGVPLLRNSHRRPADLLHDVTGLESLEKQGHGSAGLGDGILAPGCLVVHRHIPATPACDRVIALAAVEHIRSGDSTSARLILCF